MLDILPLDRHALESAFDPDEISRVEFTAEYTYIIWKRPNKPHSNNSSGSSPSVGLFLQQGKLVMILGDSNFPFTSKEFRGLTSPTTIILEGFRSGCR